MFVRDRASRGIPVSVEGGPQRPGSRRAKNPGPDAWASDELAGGRRRGVVETEKSLRGGRQRGRAIRGG